MAWETLSSRRVAASPGEPTIQDRAWDKRWHRRFAQAACSSGLGVRAAKHWPGHEGQRFGAPSLLGERMGTIQGHRECPAIS